MTIGVNELGDGDVHVLRAGETMHVCYKFKIEDTDKKKYRVEDKEIDVV